MQGDRITGTGRTEDSEKLARSHFTADSIEENAAVVRGGLRRESVPDVVPAEPGPRLRLLFQSRGTLSPRPRLAKPAETQKSERRRENGREHGEACDDARAQARPTQGRPTERFGKDGDCALTDALAGQTARQGEAILAEERLEGGLDERAVASAGVARDGDGRRKSVDSLSEVDFPSSATKDCPRDAGAAGWG